MCEPVEEVFKDIVMNSRIAVIYESVSHKGQQGTILTMVHQKIWGLDQNFYHGVPVLAWNKN